MAPLKASARLKSGSEELLAGPTHVIVDASSLGCTRKRPAVHPLQLRADALVRLFRGEASSGRRRRLPAGEVVRQCGHDGDAEDGEGSGDDEGGQVAARHVFEEP